MRERINFFSERVTGLSYFKIARISVIVLGAVLFFSVFQQARVWRAHHQLSQVQGEIANLKSRFQILSMADSNGGSPVEKVTQEMAQEPSWSDVLQKVATALPSGIWLEEIKGDISELGAQMNLAGTVAQPHLLPEFLAKLRNLPLFEKVNLLSSEAGETSQDNSLKFKIQIFVKR